MPDPASTIQRTPVLRRVDPEHSMARFYAFMIERYLFGTICLVRCWAWIDARGRDLAEELGAELLQRDNCGND